MAKKQTEVRCPSCGATITKDYFLNNYDCPNCHDDLSDEEDILAAFGLNESDDEPEDIFEQLLKGSRYGEKNKTTKTVSGLIPDDNEIIIEEQEELDEVIDNSSVNNNTSLSKNTVATEEKKSSIPEKTDAMYALKAALSKTLEPDDLNKQTHSQLSSQSKLESPTDAMQDFEGKKVDTESSILSFETKPNNNDTFISEEDFINDDLYSGTSETKLVKDNSLESLVSNIEDDKLDDTRTKKDNLLSAADFIRAKLSNTNEDNGPKIIDMEKRENVPDDFNSNWDGYYDDTKSTIPPEPDVVNFKTIRRVVGSIVGIILVSIFLIYWA